MDFQGYFLQEVRSHLGQNLSHRIDVLGDDHLEQPGGVQPGQRQVAGIRGRVAHLGPALDLLAPVLPAGGGIGQELGELDRAHRLPEALRAVEVGNPAFGRDPRTGEGHGVADFPDAGSAIWASSWAFTMLSLLPPEAQSVKRGPPEAHPARGQRPQRATGRNRPFQQGTPALHTAARAGRIPGKRRAGGSEEREGRTPASDERTATEPAFSAPPSPSATTTVYRIGVARVLSRGQ